MRSPTIPTAAAMAQSTVTRSCGAEPCPAPRTGGGSGWGCCNTAGSPGGCATGVDRDLITDIMQNPEQYYVNVHNADFPAGALRGQLG